MQISFSDLVTGTNLLTSEMFGVNQTGFGPISSFSNAFDALQGGHVRWPGGNLSESRPDVYGFDLPGLFDASKLYSGNPNLNRPALPEMLAFCIDRDIGLTIQIPTARYQNDLASLDLQLTSFLNDLKLGLYGPLPDSIQLEIGNEYYATSAFSNSPGEYGLVANQALKTANDFFSADPTFDDGSISFGVQMGRSDSDNQLIQSKIDPANYGRIDYVVAHHQVYRFEAIDKNILTSQNGTGTLSKPDLISTLAESWQDLLQSSKQPNFNVPLVLSEWAVGEASASKIADWTYQDIGARQGSTILDMFSTYVAIGVDAASFWGVGTDNPNAIIDVNGRPSVGAAVLTSLGNNVVGKRLLAAFESNNRNDDFMTFAFRDFYSADLFVTANDIQTGGQQLTLDLSDFGDEVSVVGTTIGYSYSNTMPSGTPWSMHRLFEEPTVLQWHSSVDQGQIDLNFSQDYEIQHLSISLKNPNDAEKYFFGFEDAPVVTGSNASDVITTFIGQNLIQGNEGADIILGGITGDLIFGGNGDDFIIADPSSVVFGNDVLVGGNGNDRLAGGGGADVFLFRPNEGSNVIAVFDVASSNRTTQTPNGADFDPAIDTLFLADFGFRNTSEIISQLTYDPTIGVTFSAQGTQIALFDVHNQNFDEWNFEFI